VVEVEVPLAGQEEASAVEQLAGTEGSGWTECAAGEHPDPARLLAGQPE
jgi:hypothetical protein